MLPDFLYDLEIVQVFYPVSHMPMHTAANNHSDHFKFRETILLFYHQRMITVLLLSGTLITDKLYCAQFEIFVQAVLTEYG